jgi:hypothetical protein
MKSAHQELIEQLRVTVSRERLAALEADPIALADFLASQADDFIRREMQSNKLVYKENPVALVAAEPERHLVDVEEVGEAVYELRKNSRAAIKFCIRACKSWSRRSRICPNNFQSSTVLVISR